MKKLILCMSMMATMASAQDVFLRGNIVMTTTQLQPQGGDVYRGEVTLDDADVFLFSDKYVYFECPSTGYKSSSRPPTATTTHTPRWLATAAPRRRAC